MTQRKIWPKAEIARVFVRPVTGLSEEVQMRMIDRALEKLGLSHEIYKSKLTGDKQNERGSLLHDARHDEVIIVARLNVLARTRVEVRSSITIDFTLYVSALLRKCKYILVLDDNLGEFESIISDDEDWDEVMERAIYVATYGRKMSSEEGRALADKRWAGKYRGVVKEWTKNPERAKDLEDMARIWRDPKFKNDQEAYDALPDEVRKQIKSLVTARRIFGRRKPNNKNLGRKKKVNGLPGSASAIYDIIEDGSIVYTGMTDNPYDRMKAHLSTGTASNDAYMEIIEWHGNRRDAFAAETVRINVLLPPRNTKQVEARAMPERGRHGSF